jgi:hypothetical protein
MNDFFKSTAARLLALSVGIALVGGAASALMQPGDGATILFSASLFVPVVVNVVGLPSAIEEHWSHAVMAVILLPWLLFLWVVALGVLRAYYPPAFAYPFLVAGFAALAAAARPSREGIVMARPAEQH